MRRCFVALKNAKVEKEGNEGKANMGGSALKNAKVEKERNEGKANMGGQLSGNMYQPSIFAVFMCPTAAPQKNPKTTSAQCLVVTAMFLRRKHMLRRTHYNKVSCRHDTHMQTDNMPALQSARTYLLIRTSCQHSKE